MSLTELSEGPPVPLTRLSDQVDAMAVLIRRLFSLVRILAVVLFIIAAVVVVLEIQVARRNGDIDRLEESSKLTKEAADATYVMLRNAIESSTQAGSGTSDAIAAIARIEMAVNQMAENVNRGVQGG